jgi:hypothetical protein
MKIIDFERKGNLVRFYLGDDDLVEWYGDDWDEMFPFDDLVLEPCSGTCDSGWCKDDMVAQKVPCIIQVPAAVHSDSFDESFDHWVGAKGVHKFYFGDHMEPSATATTNPHS